MSTLATWLEWACDEDGETVWVRHDVAHQAEALVGDFILDGGNYALDDVGLNVMVRGLNEYDEQWLWVADGRLEHDDAVVYRRFEVVWREDLEADRQAWCRESGS